MKSVMLLFAGAVTLAGCSTLKAADVPSCHGPRRAANPHGSVLMPESSSTVLPAAAVGPGGGCGRQGR